ncbi:MAG: hypothetical protein IJ305_01880 [Oscillospiraceae bacterium]|nr:hypothetical protein [Oscillospiraceae bacterium]
MDENRTSREFEIASQEITPYLEKDEQIIWAGRSKLDRVVYEPLQIMKLHGISRYLQLGAMLLAIVFLVFLPFGYEGLSLPGRVFGTELPWKSRGIIFITAILFIVLAQMLHRMSCAVTNKRVMIIRAGELKSYPLDSISDPEIKSYTNGRSDVSFYANVIAGIHVKDGNKQKYTLFNVLNGETVYALLYKVVYSEDKVF